MSRELVQNSDGIKEHQRTITTLDKATRGSNIDVNNMVDQQNALGTKVDGTCLRFRIRRHVVAAFVRLNIQHHIRNIGGLLFFNRILYTTSRAKVTCNH